MKVDCYLQAHINRTQYLKQSIESINAQSIFSKKLISICGNNYAWGGEHPSREITNLLIDTNWTITYDNSNRVTSFKNAVSKLDSPFIFYTEDDIALLQLPDMHIILKQKYDRKTLGMLSLNLGGSTFDYPRNFGDLQPLIKHELETPDLLIVRDWDKRSNYFFEFPCVFMNKEMLTQMLPVLKPGNIEEELTFAYKHVSHLYYKMSLCKAEFEDLMKQEHPIENFRYKMESCKFYRLLDPNQGGVQWDLNLIK